MSFKCHLASWAGTAMVGAVLLLAAPGTASAAGDVSKEIGAAEQHAEFATKATDIKMVHAHLQHVVNCMVGPKGKGFDAAQLNPCKDLGDGVLPDTKDKAKKSQLNKALSAARAGLKASKIETAQKHASDAMGMLKQASM